MTHRFALVVGNGLGGCQGRSPEATSQKQHEAASISKKQQGVEIDNWAGINYLERKSSKSATPSGGQRDRGRKRDSKLEAFN